MKRRNGLIKWHPAVSLAILCADATVEEMRALVRRHGAAVIREDRPARLLVKGYDKDPRELWQIPEARDLCSRIIESGLLSLLAVNLEDDRIDGLWGSWDVWSCARELIEPNGRCEVTPEAFDRFCNALERANTICDTILRGIEA